MFTNVRLGEAIFMIAFVGSDPACTSAFFEDLRFRAGQPEKHTLPGAENFSYLARDPVRAGPNRARFECYALLDSGPGCVATVAKADALVVVPDRENEMVSSAEHLARMVRTSGRSLDHVPVIVAGDESRVDAGSLPGAVMIPDSGSPFDVFKMVAKVVLTALMRGELREHNLHA